MSLWAGLAGARVKGRAVACRADGGPQPQVALPLGSSLKPREWVRESWQGVLLPWVPWAEQETALSAPRAPRHTTY